MNHTLNSICYRLNGMRRGITYSVWFINLIASMAVLFFYFYFSLLKIRYYFHPEFLKIGHSKVLFGFWHGRQFLLIPSFRHFNAVAMSDVSWAGDIQSKILARMNYLVVRGSSKRKSVQALIRMKKIIEDGHPGAFALDGPSGPIYRSKPGILFLARKLGYPIIPVTASADRAWVLGKTWCHYLLPKPFARCYVAMGKPIGAINSEKPITTDKLDRILIEWTSKADHIVGWERRSL
ncbi:DUF374 domain-containing protein [bacterium]|nr:DUF374 domain-containing protein [bacterium]